MTKLTIKLFAISLSLIGCADKVKKKITFERQLGTYILDINRTNLGSYEKDSNIYKNLKITFNGDSTFIMNIRVPFFADSIGTWIAGNGSVYSYNQLFYKNVDYKEMEGNQFFPPYLKGSDSIFLMNGVSANKGAEHIHEIYFKKIK